MGRIVSQTETTERLVRIADAAVQLHIGMMHALKTEASAAFSKMHQQFRGTIEILGLAQTGFLLRELTCPDENGAYFFQRYSWQRSASRVFLACYSFFRNLEWMKKLELAELPKMSRIIAGNLSLLRLATECSYIFYRAFVFADSVRTGTTWKIAVSVGKIVVTASFLIISAWKVQSIVATLGLTALNLVLDCCILKKRVEYA